MMFDLDRFKSINDRFGHSVGDHALKVFAAAASANVRASDVPGRLGGEEFAAIIPGNAADAGLVAERLRVAFQAAGVVISGHEIGATVSIGIVTATAPAQLDALLARGDAALPGQAQWPKPRRVRPVRRPAFPGATTNSRARPNPCRAAIKACHETFTRAG